MARVRACSAAGGEKRECPHSESRGSPPTYLPMRCRRGVPGGREEGRTVSEFMREAIRLYMGKREWRSRGRLKRLRSRPTTDQEEADKGTEG